MASVPLDDLLIYIIRIINKNKIIFYNFNNKTIILRNYITIITKNKIKRILPLISKIIIKAKTIIYIIFKINLLSLLGFKRYIRNIKLYFLYVINYISTFALLILIKKYYRKYYYINYYLF